MRELERNIKTLMYERTLSNQIKVQNEKQNDLQKNHSSAGLKTEAQIKDPYILEFLGIKPELSNSEKSIENAIISNLEKFLLERFFLLILLPQSRKKNYSAIILLLLEILERLF